MFRLIFKYFNRVINALKRRVIIFWERSEGLDFTKSISLEELGLDDSFARSYIPSSTNDLRKSLKQMNIKPTDSILDYGSGKGVAMKVMSEFNFKCIGGVEISQSLIDICKNNLTKLGIKNTIIYNCDARALIDLDEFNYFYFYNPFPSNILAVVLNNIAASYVKNPRKLTIIYYNPGHRHVIDSHPLFKEAGGFKGKKHDLIFYTCDL